MSDSFLDHAGLSKNHKDVFHLGMSVLDSNFRPPLLWSSPKLSSWYSVGLLARDGPGDNALAQKLLYNALLLQEKDERFEKNHGSHPWASDPAAIWTGEIYDAYDPNNALFVTMAGMMVLALFEDKIDPELADSLRKAMHLACIGNAKRHKGWYGDDMSPSYTNPWFLRCVCTTYTAAMLGDTELGKQAEGWLKESVALFDEYDTPGEFNSPTYAGVTLMALALAQYCPPDAPIRQVAPRLMRSIWVSQAETYNPSLKNVAGPWDRSYGYCMTQYYATVGANIASVVGLENAPIPFPLNGSEHSSDAALIPMQMLTAPYTEEGLTEELRAKFKSLYGPHLYTPKSLFPPHDKNPRKYTYWLEEGLSIGGIEFDEDRIGGPKGIPAQYNPGVIQWDSGKHGHGCGWISVWPNSACTSIVASSGSLKIGYPKSVDFDTPRPKSLILRIGCLPGMQLDQSFLAEGKASLPGLDVKASGSIASSATRSVTFALSQKIHGALFYEVIYTFSKELQEAEEVDFVLDITKTVPLEQPYRF